jgi:hypothetical protein
VSTPVTGPANVKVGDLVEVRSRGVFERCATVTKVTPDKLTARLPNGKTTTQAYQWNESVESGGRWRTRSTRVHVTFHLLTEGERWAAARPITPDIRHREVDRDAIRDRPDDVCAQVHALSAWLKAEPSKEAP